MREINLTEVPNREIPMNADPETFIQPQPAIIDAAAVCLISPSEWSKAQTRIGISGIGYIYVAETPEQVRQMVSQATSRA